MYDTDRAAGLAQLFASPNGLILTTPLTKLHCSQHFVFVCRCKLRTRPQRQPHFPLVD